MRQDYGRRQEKKRHADARAFSSSSHEGVKFSRRLRRSFLVISSETGSLQTWERTRIRALSSVVCFHVVAHELIEDLPPAMGEELA
jgi:hypothetical protein